MEDLDIKTLKAFRDENSQTSSSSNLQSAMSLEVNGKNSHL